MNKSRFVLALVFIGALLLSTVAVVSGGQDKVDVCHITGTHDFDDGEGEVPIGHVITIADPAYPAHIEHGDPPAHIEVQLPDGTWVCKAAIEGKIVFVTSQCWQGNFGSVQQADMLCQTAAENGELAHLGSPSFRAWLSDSVNDAKAHALDSEYVGMYISPLNDVIAFNNADLLDGIISHCINCTEFKEQIVEPQARYVWTGTETNGTVDVHGDTCTCWTSCDALGNMGLCHFADSYWTNYTSFDCNNTARLYCIQQ